MSCTVYMCYVWILCRQVNKEAKKEEATLQEKRELTNTINDMALHLERQDAQIRELNRTVADLGIQSDFIMRIALQRFFVHRFSKLVE